jgi:crossover junction endodeoxyribonuclease RuvC
VRIAGIDPGLEGGLAVLDAAGDVLALAVMPVVKMGRKGCRGGKAELDLTEIRGVLRTWDVTHVYLERVSAMRGWGASSAWRFGTGWGQIQGLVFGLGLGLCLVAPKTWQAAVLGGTSRDKTQAIVEAARRWPMANLRPGRRTRPHDGLADALCLAEFGRRQLVGDGTRTRRARRGA